MGKIYVIGIGPGDSDYMTRKAYDVLQDCEVVLGYKAYIDLIEELVEGKEVISRGMGQEVERCKLSIEKALQGKTVALVCSGDGGLYGMAGLLLTLLTQQRKQPEVTVEVIPGVTAAMAASSLLGAPIVEDFCTISLSDYMNAWEKIKKRLSYACLGDFVIALYNPRSKARPHYLQEALDIVMQHRSVNTPVGIVRNAYRKDQQVICTTLGELVVEQVDMFSTVIIGNSRTSMIDKWMVTDRGYAL